MALEAYIIHILIIIGIYVILALSLDLAIGYTGLLNIGHVAFYAVGAYTSALLALNFGTPFLISFLAGGIIAGIFSLVVAIPALKLRGDYLAVATLGLAIIVENILKNWTSLTRGPLGLPGIPKPTIFGITLTGITYLALVIVVGVVTYYLLRYLIKTPFGRILQAIREDELVAKSLGKNVTKYKTQALLISAFFAGLAGSLYAHYITFIDPTSFSILESVLIISMIVVGGIATLKGAIIGAIILILLPEALRFLPLPSSMIGALRQIIYAVLLVVLLIKRPQGLLGKKTEGVVTT
tara:strand:- start:74942 stop:75829 length:888 start_codon:yes stop_codon:yes gene_type:complete